MDFSANDPARDATGTGTVEPDPLRRLVQVALVIYLMPVIAVVLAIGGASILVGGATRVARKFASSPRPGLVARRAVLPRSAPSRSAPSMVWARRSDRVGS